MKEKIKVLLVDDQPLFIHSLAQVIKYRAPDIEIVGIADNGREAIIQAQEKKPQIIIMDIMMPQINGVEATKIILEKQPNIKIMILTTFDEDEYVLEALNLGAKGYLLKNLLPEDVITAIRALISGVDQISPSIIRRITSKLNYPTIKKEKKTIDKWYSTLTILEEEIIKSTIEGMTNKEIASELNLAEQTVKNYLNKIFNKANVHKRAQLIKLCITEKIFF